MRTKLDHAAVLPIYALALLLIVLAAWLIARGEAGMAIMPSLFALALFAFALQRRHFLKTSDLFPGVWLAGGRCPSCNYRLDEIHPAGDGCTVCPECGAAWMITRGRGSPPDGAV